MRKYYRNDEPAYSCPVIDEGQKYCDEAQEELHCIKDAIKELSCAIEVAERKIADARDQLEVSRSFNEDLRAWGNAGWDRAEEAETRAEEAETRAETAEYIAEEAESRAEEAEARAAALEDEIEELKQQIARLKGEQYQQHVQPLNG